MPLRPLKTLSLPAATKTLHDHVTIASSTSGTSPNAVTTLEDDVRTTYRNVGTPAKSILVKPNAAAAAYVTERVTRRGD